jgi:hypothetical protein
MARTPLEQHDGELPEVRTIGSIFLIDLTGRRDDDYPDHQKKAPTLATVLTARDNRNELYAPVLLCLVEIFGLILLAHLVPDQ